MSAWVVTPAGVVMEYPTCRSMRTMADGRVQLLKQSEPEIHLAWAPPGSVVSFAEPCNLRGNPNATVHTIQAAIQIAAECCERVPAWDVRHELATLKTKLERFDRRTLTWKDSALPPI